MARILLVDDSADIRHLLGTILKDEGHDVAVASDGVQAIEAIKNHAPDLMILDIMMPRMDGYGVLKEMRDGGIKEDVKILVLTAKAAEADWVRGYKLGADDYLTKPFGADELVDAVNTLLKMDPAALRKRSEQELDKAQLLSRLESMFQNY
jgi:two-component system, OmpR family, response regulator